MILLTITTITPLGWKKKLKEVKDLKLKEIALFLTCSDQKERKELYQALKETAVKRIPFVHLKSDMELWELNYLIKNYQVRLFNTHPQKEHPFLYNLDKYKKNIYIENVYAPLGEAEIKKWGGICLDFSHLENGRVFFPEKYQHNIRLLEKYGCGCNHLGPAKDYPFNREEEDQEQKNPHLLKDFSELDYLKNYPLKYFSPYVAIEVENSIKDQLKIRDYLINLFNL